MGPLTPAMKGQMEKREGDIKYKVGWTTLGQYMEGLERRGISPNVASYVGEATVREICSAKMTYSRTLCSSTPCAVS